MKENLPIRGVLGLGKESTLFYLNQIQEKYRKRNQEYATCPLMMYQIDFQDINHFLPNQFSVLIPKMKRYFEEISGFGISKLLIPNITLHETIDQISFPFIICHPIFLTLKHLKENNISEIILFGTSYTMNSAYLHRKFSEKNISVNLPTHVDQAWIEKFRKAVDAEKISSTEILYFQQLIKKYSSKCPVVIACTELSLFALKNDESCIDMADLQIEEFLK